VSEEAQDPKAPVRLMSESEAAPSSMFHVSVRGWLAIGLAGTVCFMQATGKTVDEPLYTLATVALGYYFGQKGQKP
jgi:hypothetical protein